LTTKEPACQNRQYSYAHLDRIEHLLRRRDKSEQEREGSISTALERAAHQLEEAGCLQGIQAAISGSRRDAVATPLRWASGIPSCAWRDRCSPRDCYERHETVFDDASGKQRPPFGPYAHIPVLAHRFDYKGRSSLSSRGHVFAVEPTAEAKENFTLLSEV